MGVYRIKNTQKGTSYIGYSVDLHAIMNRQRTELKFGTHRNTQLLEEWKTLGASAFEFEILDELAHDEQSDADPMEELRILGEMWMAKIQKAGEFVVKL